VDPSEQHTPLIILSWILKLKKRYPYQPETFEYVCFSYIYNPTQDIYEHPRPPERNKESSFLWLACEATTQHCTVAIGKKVCHVHRTLRMMMKRTLALAKDVKLESHLVA
jgi:hypothetical protein